MTKTVTARIGWAIFTLGFVSAVVFLAVEALPGDVCTAYLQRFAQGARLQRCIAQQGLDQPALLRYLHWLLQAFQGDFGTSMKRGQPISALVAGRFLNTALLAASSSFVGVPAAIALGFLAGLHRDRPVDLVVSTVALVAMTVPEFVTAAILIYVFAILLGWFPAVMTLPPSAPVAQMLPNLVLPVSVLALVLAAHILRLTRTAVIDVAASDFVRMARLKGVPESRIRWRHIAPSALIPAVNIVALTVAWLLSGVVVVEQVFNYPGMGTLMLQAMYDRDMPLVQAIVLIFAAVYIVVNLVADLVMLALDPQLRTEGQA